MPSRLARGQRVGSRYRLERELGHGADGTTWEAVDERLDRRVALRMFDPSLDHKTIVKRAGLAASLTHPRVVRVFDTGEDAGRFFTVSELVSECLINEHQPVAVDAAVRLGVDIAEALDYAHERGVVHGNLHEGNVMLSESGAKVGDFALSTPSEHAGRDDDLKAFGVLMARVTGLSEPAAAPGLARVIEGLTAGAYASASDVLKDLYALRPAPTVARTTSPPRSWLVFIVAILLALVAFGILRLGERSPSEQLEPGGRIEGTPLTVVGIRSYDPQTTDADKTENPETVRNAVDADPQTFWSTESYKSGADFSGLKDGVGLIVDVGRSRDVGKSQVLWAAQGCSFEIRSSENKEAPLEDWEATAEVSDSPISAALRFEAAKARYWMLWITHLAVSQGTHRCSVRDFDLFAP